MHPRPHLRRSAWLDLDGAWSFALDPTDQGEREGWFRGRPDWPFTINVPFPWESPRAGLTAAPAGYVRGVGPTQGEIGWYRRSVTVPTTWAGERVWLVVGAAYWRTRIWVNGVLATEHDGGYDPFEVDITDLVVGTRDSDLVVRVWAPSDTDEYPHGKNTRHWYTRASGIWQTVFIEPRPATHVERLRTTPDLARSRLETVVNIRSDVGGEVGLTIALLLTGALVAEYQCRLAVSPGVTIHRHELAVSAPQPWSLADPNLYDLRVTVEGSGSSADVVSTLVGFRTVAFERPTPEAPRQLVLNGQPIYLRAVMSQGYHPDGILAYPDEDVIRHDLESAKRLGFNMVRLHVKLEDPRVLAWADRLGILLWCEVPNFLTPSHAARRRWEHTWRAMLERDSGHPSIALWCMFIESWGLGTNQFGFGTAERAFADDPEAQAWVEAMHRLGRSLDPTRPIIENSVSEGDHTIAEVNDIHLFPVGYGELQDLARSRLDEWLDNSIPGSPYNFVPSHRQGDQPLMVSSMAGWSSVDGVETSWPLRTLLNEVRARSRIAGYGWVQLYDVEWELTGLQAYDRTPKDLGLEVADHNADDTLVVLGPMARVGAPGTPIKVTLALANGCGRPHHGLSFRIWSDGIDRDWVAHRVRPRTQRCSALVRGPGVEPIGTVEFVLPEQPFAGRVWIEVLDGARRSIARTFVNAATAPVDAPSIPGTVDLSLSTWTDEADGAPSLVSIAGRPERIDASTLVINVPAGTVPVLTDDEVVFEAEAAVWVADQGAHFGAAGTREVEVGLDGQVVATIQVPLLRGSSLGTLSIVNPEGLGNHGGHLVAPLGPAQSLANRSHRLSLSPAMDGRMVLFGPNLGMAPVGPHLRIRPVSRRGRNRNN